MNINTKYWTKKIEKNNDMYLLSKITRCMTNMLLIYDSFLFAIWKGLLSSIMFDLSTVTRISISIRIQLCRLAYLIKVQFLFHACKLNTRSNFYTLVLSSELMQFSVALSMPFCNQGLLTFYIKTLKIIYSKYLDRLEMKIVDR